MIAFMLLSGCQPPPLGEAAGMRYPILYMQLQKWICLHNLQCRLKILNLDK